MFRPLLPFSKTVIKRCNKALIVTTKTGRDAFLPKVNQLPIPKRYFSVGGRNLSATGPKTALPKAAVSENNLFLDNLGKIFGLSLLSIIVFVIRSSKKTSAQTAVKEDIENKAILDPVEIEEMRSVNNELTIAVFRKLCDSVIRDSSEKGYTKITYPEFMRLVKEQYKLITKDSSSTLQFGHNLDRILFSLPNYTDKTEYTLVFLLTVISMCCYSTVDDRVTLLWDVVRHYDAVSCGGVGDGGDNNNNNKTDNTSNTTTNNNNNTNNNKVNHKSMQDFLQILATTNQLPPEVYPIETDTRYPFQTYSVATGEDLLRRLRTEEDADKVLVTKSLYGAVGDDVGEDEFKRILKAKGVCAWGECYRGIKRYD
jgi:hypothetical protein